MRIIFWGSERESCVTSNMLILAGHFSCQKGYRVCLIELADEKRRINSYFPGKRKHYIKHDIETLMLHQLYYALRETWKDTNTLNYLETNMDMLFLNLGNRTDSQAREMMHNADLVVVNLKQDFKSFDTFYAEYANLSARIFLLIGNYYEDGCCNREQLQRKYDIKETRLGVIPNNPEYEIACTKGQIGRYLKKSNPKFMSAIKSVFIREVEKTAELLYQNIGVTG